MEKAICRSIAKTTKMSIYTNFEFTIITRLWINLIFFRQLSKTHDVLRKTKENLENQCESKRE